MSLRQRVPFKFSADAEEDNGRILDEQEQEELIQKFKKESSTRNAQYVFLLHVLLGLSCILHLVYLFSSSKRSPLAAFFPNAYAGRRIFQPIPFASLFALAHIGIHILVGINLLPRSQQARFPLPDYLVGPLSWIVLYSAPFVAPLTVFCLGDAWVDVAWWAITFVLVCFMHRAKIWMEEETEEIRELEDLRYDARGA